MVYRRRRTPYLIAALLGASVLACGRRYPVGELTVRTVDASGAPVSGVAVDLFKIAQSSRTYWRAARTGADGTAVLGARGGIIEGDYTVHITPLAFQALAAGEANDRRVHVAPGDKLVLVFHVVSRKPVRPVLPPPA